jgi:signal transduction histidine kinase
MIHSSLDNALAGSAEAMVDSILAAGVSWDVEHIGPLVPNGSGFVLYAIRDQAGGVRVSWGVSDASLLPFSAWEVVPAGPVGGVHRLVGDERAGRLTGSAQKLRLITLPFRHDDELFYFQAAVHDQALERLLGPFLDLVLLGVPVGVVAAMIAGWVIAGRAVAPIHQLSEAARDVSPTSLSERFEVPTSDSEVERLELELNFALERLEAGYRAQDQFIGNVSHELRTPVAVLLIQAQVAKMGERSLEKGYAFVDKAETLLKRLGKVVDSVLVLARADLAHNPPRDAVSVIDLILGCQHTCKDFAEQNQVRLIPRLLSSDDKAPDLTLKGDAALLQTMVENLVQNAISHSPPGGEVALEAYPSEASIHIVVRDQGSGIPEEYLERIFERFVQVPEGSARRDGTGLGLAIANGIALLHGGTIGVQNNAGGGCSFIVTLPPGEPGSVDTEPGSPPPPAEVVS